MNPLTFSRGFLFCELRMDLLNSLQVKSSEKVLKYMIWSTVNGATVCFKSEICVFERVKIHYVYEKKRKKKNQILWLFSVHILRFLLHDLLFWISSTLFYPNTNYIFQEFKVSKNAILMTVIAGMGFTINWGAAMFLTYKLKRNNYSPFLR